MLPRLVDEAHQGNEVEITRRGKAIAKLVVAGGEGPRPLPDMAAFRASIKIKGASLSDTVIKQRRDARY